MDLSASAQIWVNVVLLWIGFGVVVGLLAQIFLPSSSDSHGLWKTLVAGMAGSCLGPALISTVWKMDDFNPISPFGLFASVLAALAFLLTIRSTQALFFRRKETGPAKEPKTY